MVLEVLRDPPGPGAAVAREELRYGATTVEAWKCLEIPAGSRSLDMETIGMERSKGGQMADPVDGTHLLHLEVGTECNVCAFPYFS